MIFGAMVAMAEPPGGVKKLPTGGGSELTTGLYYITANTEIKGSSAQCGLKVKSGQTAAIYIPKGVTLTVTGGDGIGRTGGGAGIGVPKDATLVVVGGGTLKATGGNARQGGFGSAAKASQSLDDHNGNVHNNHYEYYEDILGWEVENIKLVIGDGGAGGDGTGGAGAGIGGSGGDGGTGGGAGAGFSRTGFSSIVSGNNGNAGIAGSKGSEGGTLYALTDVTVDAKSGSAGKGGGGGSYSSLQCTWSMTYYYVAYGSGGGGGGGGGGAAQDIGGGGAGGGGGGGGGTGSCTWYGNDDDWPIRYDHSGRGGGGGKSTTDANNGSEGGCQKGGTITFHGTTWSGDKCIGSYGSNSSKGAYGSGGSGGSAGATPDAGNVYRSPGATVNKNEGTFKDETVVTHESIKYTVKFSDPNGVLINTPANETTYLGRPYPQVKPSTTKNIGLVLDGWFTAATGGTKVYDGMGKPLLSSYEHYEGDLTLYPQTKKAENVPCGVYVNGLEVGKPGVTLPAGCVYEDGIVHINGNGPYTLSGANVLGQVAFRVEGANEVSLVLDGLTLRNERAGFGGLIDIASSTNVTISVTAGKTTTLEASGDSVAAIHCPTGTSVKIEGKRSDGDRKIKVYNDWAVADAPFALGCDYGLKGTTVDLSLRSGPGAATIGGIRGEPCGNITLVNCDLNCIPNSGTKADRVHEIGDGLLGAKDNLNLGGHVDIVGIVGMLCPLRSGTSDVNALTIARPRPHDVYGVPLMPAWWGDWIIFVRPGVLEWATSTTIVIPRSGQSVR